jgi:hypothetical protein
MAIKAFGNRSRTDNLTLFCGETNMRNLRNLKHKILFIFQADYNVQRTRISEVNVLYFVNGKAKQEILTCQQIVFLINVDRFDVATAAVDSKNELHFAEVLGCFDIGASPVRGEFL